MPDKRPVELASYLEATAERNDALILTALAKLEDGKTRGKFKPTVSSVCSLSGLSRNTIRNRQWALERLNAIKQRLKTADISSDGPTRVEEDEGAILDKLRRRTKNLLEQNALLYEEVLSLRRTLERKEIEMAQYNHGKLKQV